MLGGLVVDEFTYFNRTWDVMIQAEPEFRANQNSISAIYVRNNTGQMVPLRAVSTVRRGLGTDFIQRFNTNREIEIFGANAPGYSTGQAIAAMAEVATKTVPAGYTFGWSGTAYQEVAVGNTQTIIFVFSVLLVFLALAAQYESWMMPLAVLLAVPTGIFGAFLSVLLWRLDNNIYVQIGIIMLIGLAAKNAVLIVEFARERRAHGASIRGGGRRGASALPADPHDVVRVHHRRDSADVRARRRRGVAAVARFDGVRRHARRDVPRHLLHADVLRALPAVRRAQKAEDQPDVPLEAASPVKNRHEARRCADRDRSTHRVVRAADAVDAARSQGFRRYRGDALTAASLGDVPWRKLYDDPVLQGLIERRWRRTSTWNSRTRRSSKRRQISASRPRISRSSSTGSSKRRIRRRPAASRPARPTPRSFRRPESRRAIRSISSVSSRRRPEPRATSFSRPTRPRIPCWRRSSRRSPAPIFNCASSTTS